MIRGCGRGDRSNEIELTVERSVPRWFWPAFVAVALLAAACGDDGTAGDEEDVASSTTTTIAETTSTTGTSPETSSSTSTTEPGPTEEISVFFGTGDPDVCEAVAPHARTVPAGADPIRFAFDELVAGPTDREREQGAGSFFSDDTERTVRSATTDGRSLVVDFEDFRDVLTPAGANTSCGSAALLAELSATAFQFPSITLVRYELEGSCDRFGEWLQRGCIEVDRTEWAEAVASQLPGEPFDGVLPPGAILAVISVAADDQLNVRAQPGADRPIIGRLDPLTTGLVFSGRERLITPARSVWYEIEQADLIGWVNARFAAPLGETVDLTSEIVEAAGEIPTGATMEEIGDTVIEIRVRFVDIEPSSIIVDGPRTAGDLIEITYDLTGFRDDAVLGERLRLFAEESGPGSERLELVRAEMTAICARGSGSGICP
jgi:hypothetical protein